VAGPATEEFEPGDSALEPTPTTETTVVQADPDDVGATISAFDLVPGDCFDEPEGEFYDRVELLACDGPHDSEVFAVFTLEGDRTEPYPGDPVVEDDAYDACEGEHFREYVGVAYAQSRFVANIIAPTRETWVDLGDREVVCTLSNPNRQPLQESAAGSNE
jgi:hypothetical protein